jgi:replicative DNA helicase
MTGGKGLDALEVTLADPDDRRPMEVAVLATLAKEGPSSDYFDAFSGPYLREALNFHFPDLGAIAQAVFDLGLQNLPADARLVTEAIKGQKISEDDVRAVLDPGNAKPAAVALEYVKDLVNREAWRKLEAIPGQTAAALKSYHDLKKDPKEAAALLLRGLLDMADDPKHGLFKKQRTEAEETPGFLDDLENRRQAGRKFTGLESGFPHLDEVLNGLAGLNILAAMPSAGKTSLSKQIADQVAGKEGVPVLFFSYEQSAEELRIKSLARLSKVNSRRIQKGRTTETPDDWQAVKDAAGKYQQGPGRYLKIIEADATFTPDRIRAAVQAEKNRAEGKRVLVIIDYLQLVPAGVDLPSVRERVDFVLSQLRRISRDLDVAVLAVSSMNRAGYSQERKRSGDNAPQPAFEYLKESGGIEYSADVVMVLRRDKKESEDQTNRLHIPTTRIEAHILKNRNGELSKIPFNFFPAWSSFSEEGRSESLEDDSPF